MANNKFGYLNTSADPTKIKDTQSLECFNINPTEGFINPKSFSRKATDYKCKTTFYGNDRIYVIAGKTHGYTESNWIDSDGNSVSPTAGDLYRLAIDYDDTTNPVVEKVGIENPNYNITGSFDAVRDFFIADTYDNVKNKWINYVQNNAYLPNYGTDFDNPEYYNFEKTLSLIPVYDITIDTGTETFNSLLVLGDSTNQLRSFTTDVLGRSNIYFNNLPNYASISSLIDDNQIYTKEVTGDTFLTFDTNYQLDVNGGIFPHTKQFSITDKVVADYSFEINRIRLFLSWGIRFDATYETETRTVYYPSYFHYEMKVYDNNESNSDIFPISESNADSLPELYRSDFNSADFYNTDGNGKIGYFDLRMFSDVSAYYDTQITFNDEDIPVGERKALLTSERTTLYDFTVESSNSDIYTKTVYANQTNDDLQYDISITDTITVGSDADGTYFELDNKNSIINVYRKSIQYPDFYLLQSIDLSKVYLPSILNLTIYTDEEKTNELTTPYVDNVVDGTSYYLDITITDTNKNITTNEIFDSSDNYAPDEMEYILSHKQQVFYVNKNNPNELYISQIGDIDYYTKSGENLLTFDYDIVGLEKHDEVVYIATEKELYVLWGNSPDSFVLKIVNPNVNIYKNSMLAIDKGVLFAATDGIYIVNRKDYQKISNVIDNFEIFNPIVDSGKLIDNVEYRGNRYYVLEIISGIDDSFQYFIIYDTQYQGFARGDTSSDYYYKTKRFDFDGMEVSENNVIKGNELKNVFQLDIDFTGDIDIQIFRDGTNTFTKNISSGSRTHQRVWIDKEPFYDFAIKFVLNSTGSNVYNWDILKFYG